MRRFKPSVCAADIRVFADTPIPNGVNLVTLQCKLDHIRVDDWVFGVSSVSKDGYESPVASAVPGGAFKPYVAPPARQ